MSIKNEEEIIFGRIENWMEGFRHKEGVFTAKEKFELCLTIIKLFLKLMTMYEQQMENKQ